MVNIFCPGNTRTGGVEVLHQLGYKLNLMNISARMVYYGIEKPKDHQSIEASAIIDYKKYAVPYEYIGNIMTEPDDSCVFPEVIIEYLPYSKGTKRYLWWLSVTFAYMNEEKKKIIYDSPDIIHLVQSAYARDYIENTLGIPDDHIFFLSDYINSRFLVHSEFDEKQIMREDEILFNPRKNGKRVCDLIARSSGKIAWRAVKGFSYDEIYTRMHKAKLYIDFGYHPGKDRMPREALLSGCLVITNRRGAAANSEDILLPEQYKWDDEMEILNESSLDSWCSMLLHMLSCSEQIRETEEYKAYISRTEKEFLDFEKDILTVFGKNKEFENGSKEKILEKAARELQNDNVFFAYQMLVWYYQNDGDQNVMFWVLEAAVRMAIGEIHEAWFCAKKGLESDDKNYELFLLIAEADARLGNRTEELADSCEKAMFYSKGTSDEEIVKKLCEK